MASDRTIRGLWEAAGAGGVGATGGSASPPELPVSVAVSEPG
jgi:hypothetical protein